MSKASIFVMSCSMTIIVLFSVFCYLMSTVNPEPYNNVTTFRRVNDVPKEDLLYINDQLSPKEDFHYGMEKVPNGYVMTTTIPEVTSDEDHRRSNPVQIPIVRYTGSQIQSTTPHAKSLDDLKPITVLVYPMKDVRRSIEANHSTKIKQGKAKNVLLKIIDDSGKSRMEVILDSGQILYKDQSTSKMNDNKELNVYEIKPNNTLLYNVAEQSLKVIANDLPKSKNTA